MDGSAFEKRWTGTPSGHAAHWPIEDVSDAARESFANWIDEQLVGLELRFREFQRRPATVRNESSVPKATP